MVDEAHVTTIGVAPEHRGKHIGEMLFLALVDIALEMRANWLTLEVRVSNTVAQNLYRKYGMQIAGTRKRYYSDNGEDAYIMWSEPLSSPAFQRTLGQAAGGVPGAHGRAGAPPRAVRPRSTIPVRPRARKELVAR